jgi:2-succinyl-6-hydroxy-2,4-cyclohexadiene-1-carboxylate synthase
MRGSGPPLVLLHGFTQTGRLFGPFGERMAESRTLVAVDLPGHGGSDAVRADLPATAALVSESVREAIGETPCDMLGYSLGARVALHVLVGSDLSVSRAVLIGVNAGIEDSTDRARRRQQDEELATELEATGDVGRFLHAWLEGPMFARLASSEATGRSERLRNSAPGLASSLRLCGTGTQAPLWDELTKLACPILAIAGADDSRFVSHALRVACLAPRAVTSLVPGGGHAVHLSQPEQAWRLVDHWLDAVAPAVI